MVWLSVFRGVASREVCGSRSGWWLAMVACVSLFGTTALAGPSDTAARANSYDDGWQSGSSGWVEMAKNILANASDQVPGMVIHIGDSLRRHKSLGNWVQNGDGRTTEDLAIGAWMHAGETTPDINSTDGFALAAYYPAPSDWCTSRSITAVDGAGPWAFWSTSGMPRTTNQEFLVDHPKTTMFSNTRSAIS